MSPVGQPASVAQIGAAPMAHMASQVVAVAPPAPPRQHIIPAPQLSSLAHSSATPPMGQAPVATHVCVVVSTPASLRARTVQHSIGGSQTLPMPHAMPPASGLPEPGPASTPLPPASPLLVPAPLLLLELLPAPLLELLLPAPLLELLLELLPAPLLLLEPLPLELLLLDAPLLLELLLLDAPLLLELLLLDAPLLLLLLELAPPSSPPDVPVPSEPLHAVKAAATTTAQEKTEKTCLRLIVHLLRRCPARPGVVLFRVSRLTMDAFRPPTNRKWDESRRKKLEPFAWFFSAAMHETSGLTARGLKTRASFTAIVDSRRCPKSNKWISGDIVFPSSTKGDRDVEPSGRASERGVRPPSSELDVMDGRLAATSPATGSGNQPPARVFQTLSIPCARVAMAVGHAAVNA
jgi:hypothetical protein